MSLYQPGIPTGTVDLDVDYQNLQNNFEQINTTYQVDHVPLTDNTSINGYHEPIHFNPPSTTATNMPNNYPPNGIVATPGYGQIFSPQVNDGINIDQALYFLSGGNRLMQLTSNFVPANALNGTSYLPGGIIINWGNIALGSLGSFAASFQQPFRTNVWSIVGLGQTTSSPTNNVYVKQASITTAGFQVQNFSASITNFNWIAIGK